MTDGHSARGALSWRRVAVFLLAYLLLFVLASQWSGADRLFIEILTVNPAVALLGAWSPEIGAHAAGARIAAAGGGISIRNGCEGLDCYLLVSAAFLAMPMPWRTRLLGWLLGVLLAWALNLGRVIALFYAFRNDRAWFDTIHGTLAPLAIVALLSAFFAWWVARHGRFSGMRG